MTDSNTTAEASPPPKAGDDGAAPMARADLVAAVVFVILGAMILYGSWTMPRLEIRRIHPLTVPGLVPGLLSVALIACGTLLMVRSLRARSIGTWKGLGESLISEGARRVLAVLALVLVYTLGLVGWLPFAAATAIFVFAFVFLFEVWITPAPKPLVPSLAWAIGLAAVTGVSVTLVFERLFLVRLP